MAFHADVFLIDHQGYGFAFEMEAVGGEGLTEQLDGTGVEAVGFPGDIELPVVVIDEGVDVLGTEIDQRTVIDVLAFRGVGDGYADVGAAGGAAAGGIVAKDLAAIDEQLGGPERGGGPVGHALKDVPHLLPVDQVSRTVQRVVGCPLGRGAGGIIGVAPTDDGGIRDIATNDGIHEILLRHS